MIIDNSSNLNSSPGGRQPNRAIILVVLLVGLVGLSFYVVTKYLHLQLYQRANRALQQQRYRQAVSAYDRLLQTSLSDNPRLWLARGYALQGLKQYEAMQQSCDRVNEIDPQEAWGWNCQGEALYNLGKYSSAAEAFDKAINLAPQTVTFWLNKSEALLNAEDYPGAEAASQEAASLIAASPNAASDRQLAIAYNLQGKILLAQKQELEALLAFERSLAIDSNYLAARQGKGYALYQLKRYALAEQVWQSILQNSLAPEQEAITRLYRAITFCAVQNSTAAGQDFARVLELSGDRQIRAMAEAGCGIR